jgi:hypothetical protein
MDVDGGRDAQCRGHGDRRGEGRGVDVKVGGADPTKGTREAGLDAGQSDHTTRGGVRPAQHGEIVALDVDSRRSQRRRQRSMRVVKVRG